MLILIVTYYIVLMYGFQASIVNLLFVIIHLLVILIWGKRITKIKIFFCFWNFIVVMNIQLFWIYLNHFVMFSIIYTKLCTSFLAILFFLLHIWISQLLELLNLVLLRIFNSFLSIRIENIFTNFLIYDWLFNNFFIVNRLFNYFFFFDNCRIFLQLFVLRLPIFNFFQLFKWLKFELF